MTTQEQINSLHQKRQDMIRKQSSNNKIDEKNYESYMKQLQQQIDKLNVILMQEKEQERKQREKDIEKMGKKVDKDLAKLRKKK